ncbi:hypothetical protein [Marinobacter sp.]|uniref:hypothetical protein n=1 Tax=Marinobacter sp. TaxID=50741 RepID=UPI00384F1012
MAETKTDVASALLEQHVKHELASLKGTRLRKFLGQEVAELFQRAETVPMNRFVSVDQIMGVIQRTVVDMELDGGIPELAGEMAAEVMNAPVQSDTRLKDILSREQATAFLEQGLEMRAQRERLIAEIMAHPVYQELVANVVYHGLVNYLYEDNLIAKNVPGVGSMMKFSRKMANRAVPGLDETFERRIKTWLSESLPGLIARSEQFLQKALSDEEVHDTIMSAWVELENSTIAEFQEGMGNVQLQEFVVLGYDFWLGFRKTPYFRGCCQAVVEHLFTKYGDAPVSDLLADVGVTEDLVMGEVNALLVPAVDVLREEGYLEAMLRRRLEPFYRSAAVKKILQ